MEIFQAFILGAVQGLSEFLPISSSGHLVVVPWLFNWHDPGLGFNVALHWGTLLGVIVYFWQDITLLFKGFRHSLFKKTRDFQNNIYQKLSWFLIVASIPGAIVGKLLEEQAENTFRNPFLIAMTLGGFGLILWIADYYGKKAKNLDKIGWGTTILIGLSQAFAIIPGVSRSGSTMAAGLGLGLKRADAARFSFLMSIPIIFGAGLVKINQFASGVSGLELAVGFAAAAIFGFLAIKYLLRFLSNNGFGVFVWYRLALAALILIVYFGRM
ncbi:MAG: undecaprenyl-diphosphatase UppP [Candidatus Doudnabacteria bacterium CG10_big_fil_rev_8_21_14_0_10_42_18]|uniref:Undecaprenyl-diphosphatase n=1 Tax=Candidatus Doudnabacteria bacterium CG10_big_fil_rev_8_21_14_0_10_42_18 TaxID=1974552 RepID=A0A2H0VA55_9BACT|nr:MAG: undecaprenyl-diphosphatase UppP [Candidatus Doudnabacteria bacterium CG10_big_fil_rev_8_21_14_0_10_42_18]